MELAMEQQYVAPHQSTVAQPAVQAAAPAQAVAPGWYPDPWGQGEGHERWWDGITWSRDYARNPQAAAAPAAMHAQAAVAAPGEASTAGTGQGREDNSPASLLTIVIGAILIGARIFYVAKHSDAGASTAYAQGSEVGNIVGMFISSMIFSWGFTRRLGGDQFRAEHTVPLAIGITVVALIVGKVFM
jgi:hypothetical protein